MSICSANDHVPLDLGVRYLSRDIFVCESHDHPVLGSVVFVLVLNTEALSGIIISNTLYNNEPSLAYRQLAYTLYSDHKQLTTPPLELDLKALEVRFVLNNLDKTSLSTTSLLFGLSIKIKI